MREILFRGKRTDNGEWVEGFYVRATNHWHKFGVHDDWLITRSFANGGYFNVAQRYAVDPSTVGQFTGLFDKNGSRVFEGDVVRVFYDFNKYIYVVVWDQEEFDFKATNGEENYAGHYVYFGCCEQIEVVGNIHDNPELIGGSKG